MSEKGLNKADVVELVIQELTSKSIKIAKKDVESVVTAMLDVIVESVANKKKVTFVGFGSFEPRERKEREGRNPKTNQPMTIPATVVPVFTAGKPFKDAVNPGK